MRTTIEMRDDHRAALLDLAARRGRKGFSEIVAEAIEAYLVSSSQEKKTRREALGLRGSLSWREAERLRKGTTALRRSWR